MLIKAVCDSKISTMIDKFITQDHMNEYLSMLARFPQMPFENILLLISQLPNATVVCGKGAWQRYHARVCPGQKPAALLGPVFQAADYEDDESDTEATDDIVTYDVVPVYDISQINESEHTPVFTSQDIFSKAIDAIILEKHKVQILVDTDESVLKGKVIKSRYIDSEKTVYLIPGLSNTGRTTELLKQYIRLCINQKELTDYLDVMEHYVLIALAKHFNIAGADDKIRPTDLFEASQTKKRKFLQSLSSIVFKAVCDLSGKNLLSFTDTMLCNHLFESEDMSDAFAKIGLAAEMPDTEDIHFYLIDFLDRMHDMSESTYKTIYTLRERQLLFTFPPVNINNDKSSENKKGSSGNKLEQQHQGEINI